MIQLRKPPVPWPVKAPGRDYERISHHPSFCHVCTNLHPETAFSFFGIREDILYNNNSGLQQALLEGSLTVEDRENTPSWVGGSSSTRMDLGAWQASARLSEIVEAADAGCAACEVLKQGIRGVYNDEMNCAANDIWVSIVYRKGTVMRAHLSQIMYDEEGEEHFSRNQEHLFACEFYTLPGKWLFEVSCPSQAAMPLYQADSSASVLPSLGRVELRSVRLCLKIRTLRHRIKFVILWVISLFTAMETATLAN